jgi:conjugative transfer signal peptidase TraF
MTGLAVVAGVGPLGPWLVYNASGSAPIGFYARTTGTAGVGDYVLVRADSEPARAAAVRGLVPTGTPLVKRVVAARDDRVCRFRSRVRVNGHQAATALVLDQAGRALPAWSGCRVLGDGDTLLLQDHPHSFDGRYFGPTPASMLAGRIVRLGSFRPLTGIGP